MPSQLQRQNERDGYHPSSWGGQRGRSSGRDEHDHGRDYHPSSWGGRSIRPSSSRSERSARQHRSPNPVRRSQDPGPFLQGPSSRQGHHDSDRDYRPSSWGGREGRSMSRRSERSPSPGPSHRLQPPSSEPSYKWDYRMSTHYDPTCRRHFMLTNIAAPNVHKNITPYSGEQRRRIVRNKKVKLSYHLPFWFNDRQLWRAFLPLFEQQGHFMLKEFSQKTEARILQDMAKATTNVHPRARDRVEKIFQRKLWKARVDETAITYPKVDGQYQLHVDYINKWKELEQSLVEIVQLLLSFTPYPFSSLSIDLPSSTRYAQRFDKLEHAVQETKLAFRCFSYLFALVSFAIALNTDESTTSDSYERQIELPQWRRKLAKLVQNHYENDEQNIKRIYKYADIVQGSQMGNLIRTEFRCGFIYHAGELHDTSFLEWSRSKGLPAHIAWGSWEEGPYLLKTKDLLKFRPSDHELNACALQACNRDGYKPHAPVGMPLSFDSHLSQIRAGMDPNVLKDPKQMHPTQFGLQDIFPWRGSSEENQVSSAPNVIEDMPIESPPSIREPAQCTESKVSTNAAPGPMAYLDFDDDELSEYDDDDLSEDEDQIAQRRVQKVGETMLEFFRRQYDEETTKNRKPNKVKAFNEAVAAAKGRFRRDDTTSGAVPQETFAQIFVWKKAGDDYIRNVNSVKKTSFHLVWMRYTHLQRRFNPWKMEWDIGEGIDEVNKLVPPIHDVIQYLPPSNPLIAPAAIPTPTTSQQASNAPSNGKRRAEEDLVDPLDKKTRVENVQQDEEESEFVRLLLDRYGLDITSNPTTPLPTSGKAAWKDPHGRILSLYLEADKVQQPSYRGRPLSDLLLWHLLSTLKEKDTSATDLCLSHTSSYWQSKINESGVRCQLVMIKQQKFYELAPKHSSTRWARRLLLTHALNALECIRAGIDDSYDAIVDYVIERRMPFCTLSFTPPLRPRERQTIYLNIKSGEGGISPAHSYDDYVAALRFKMTPSGIRAAWQRGGLISRLISHYFGEDSYMKSPSRSSKSVFAEGQEYYDDMFTTEDEAILCGATVVCGCDWGNNNIVSWWPIIGTWERSVNGLWNGGAWSPRAEVWFQNLVDQYERGLNQEPVGKGRWSTILEYDYTKVRAAHQTLEKEAARILGQLYR